MSATSVPGAASAADADRIAVRRAVAVLLGGFVLVKLALLGCFAHNTLYVMDEYRTASFALYYDQLYNGFSPAKAVLHTVFYRLAYLLAHDSVGIMSVARAQTALLGLGMVVCVYLASRHLGRDRLESLFNVAVLLAFSTFMERVFRVRAEPLAVLFALTALTVLTRPAGRRVLVQAFVAGLLAGAAFLTTQKTVYLSVALAVGIACQARAWTDVPAVVRRVACYGLGGVVAVLAYALYFKGADFAEVLHRVFIGPAHIAFQLQKSYVDLDQFVWQTLKRNVVPYAICFAGLALAAWRFPRASDAVRLALPASVVATAFVFRHNQPWPYVFVMCLPLLALWASEVPRALGAARFARVEPLRRAGMVVVGLVLVIGLVRNFNFLDHHNANQKALMAAAESMLAPRDRYFDGVDMVVSRFPASRQSWDLKVRTQVLDDLKRGETRRLAEILNGEPKLWILNYRVGRLWAALRPYLEPAYVPVSPSILVSGARLLPGKETRFDNYWAGDYALYDAAGKPVQRPFLVDGEEMTGNVRLARGPRRVGLPGVGAPVFLLPAGLPAFIEPRAGVQDYPALYPSAYTF